MSWLREFFLKARNESKCGLKIFFFCRGACNNASVLNGLSCLSKVWYIPRQCLIHFSNTSTTSFSQYTSRQGGDDIHTLFVQHIHLSPQVIGLSVQCLNSIQLFSVTWRDKQTNRQTDRWGERQGAREGPQKCTVVWRLEHGYSQFVLIVEE